MAPRRKTSMMDSENLNHGEPSNIQSDDADHHLQSLLTSLDKDQLVDILVLLGMKIPQAAEGIRASARPTASHRKLIVHGLGEETTSQTLADSFSSYGEVEDAYVAIDRTTGKSRCFGFITFKTLESVKKALEKQNTKVDGHLARQRPPSEAEIDSADIDPRKLFVARISSDVTDEMFLRFFEKYGEIEECSLFYDKDTGTSRGVGFVTFKTVEAANAAITDPNKNLGTSRVSVEIKRVKKRQNEVQEESGTSAAPNVHNSPHNAINAPQQYRLQSQVPNRPHFSGFEPYGIQIPVAYQQHFGGYEPHGIAPVYQIPTVAYQAHYGGYEPYGIPIIPVAYGIPWAYQPGSVAYLPITGAYQPGFMAYPYYFAYQ